MSDINKKLLELEKKLDELTKKIDALVLADEEAQEILNGIPEVTDEEFIDAVYVVAEHHRASASLIQRRMGIGYYHASRIIELLESEGVISPAEGLKPRIVLIQDAKAFLEEYIKEKFRN